MKIEFKEKRQGFGNVRRVYANDVYSFDISEELYLKNNLYEKSELTRHEIDALKEMQLFMSAKDEALIFIQKKIRCEKEVYGRLTDIGYNNDTAIEVVNELKSLGYLDDRVFTRKYISEKSKLNPKSRASIKAELIAKGVSEETADSALEEWAEDDASLAETLVRKKFGKFNGNDLEIRKKIYNFLVYRGFEQEVIERLLDSLK